MQNDMKSSFKISLNKFMGFSPKVKVIVQLEFKLSYNEVTIQHVSHYTTGNVPE